MLRPGMSLALSLTDTFVDTLLRTDFAIRRYPSYAGAWPLPRPDFHRLEDACLAGHAATKKAPLRVLFCYVPGGIRTPDRRLRRPLLYPAELLGHLKYEKHKQKILYHTRC